MKPFKSFLSERVSPASIVDVGKFANKVFAKQGITVAFSKHFIDRINDDRNNPPITSAELVSIFKAAHKKHHKEIDDMEDGEEYTVHDAKHKLNMPFAIQGKKMIVKTIQRKDRWMSYTPKMEI